MQNYSKVMIMMLRLFWFLSVVLVLIAGVWLISATAKSGSRQQIAQQPLTEANASAGEQARREYVLEVIGLGVTLDKYRQGKLWDALQQGSPFTTIREQDPKKYPWTASDRMGQAVPEPMTHWKMVSISRPSAGECHRFMPVRRYLILLNSRARLIRWQDW